MTIKRVDILGVQVSAINMAQAVATIGNWISTKTKHYVCVTPAHSVMDCVNDPSLYELFNNSGMTTPDGMSLAWILKMKGNKHVERVAGSDLMTAVLAASGQKGWRHYFYGGCPGVPEKLAQTFKRKYPDLQIVGTYSPPFRVLTPAETDDVHSSINAAQPDIIWVGISSPKQERWMTANIDKLNASVLVGVGAAFDFLSGQKIRAPLWMQQIGLEWLFRFFTEPRRLWPRYRLYPQFVMLAVAQMWKDFSERKMTN